MSDRQWQAHHSYAWRAGVQAIRRFRNHRRPSFRSPKLQGRLFFPGWVISLHPPIQSARILKGVQSLEWRKPSVCHGQVSARSSRSGHGARTGALVISESTSSTPILTPCHAPACCALNATISTPHKNACMLAFTEARRKMYAIQPGTVPVIRCRENPCHEP